MTDASSFNRAYYEAESAGRDDYWRKMAAPRQRVATLLRELTRRPPRRLVDLGCGNGAFLRELARCLSATQLCGIDLSAPQIEQNRQSLPQVEWRVGNLDGDASIAEDLRGRFDAVVAMEIVEHLDRPVEFLHAARALATPGGLLCLTTQSGRVGETERRVGHRRHFSKREMLGLLEAAGWQPLQVRNEGFPFHDLSKWYANRDPDASMRRFGDKPYTWREDLVCAALRAAFRFNSNRRGAQLYAFAQRKLQAL